METTITVQHPVDVKVASKKINEYFKAPKNITVNIGPNKTCWVLPKDLLCNKIPGLITAIQPTSNSQQTVSIHLKQEDPAVFAIVVDWLLSEKLLCLKSHEDSVDPGDESHFLQWCELHAFAGRFQAGSLGVAAVNRMRLCLRASQWLPSPPEIRSVFTQLSDGHCLQQLIVAETVEAFASLSMEDLRLQAAEWAELTACHRVFQAQFLIALKVHCNIRAADTSSAAIQRKRRRVCSPQRAARATSSPNAIDLTGNTTPVASKASDKSS